MWPVVPCRLFNHGPQDTSRAEAKAMAVCAVQINILPVTCPTSASRLLYYLYISLVPLLQLAPHPMSPSQHVSSPSLRCCVGLSAVCKAPTDMTILTGVLTTCTQGTMLFYCIDLEKMSFEKRTHAYSRLCNIALCQHFEVGHRPNFT